MPVRKKRPPRPVASRGGPYGKPGRTVGMRRPRRPRRGLAHAVFPIPAPNLELVGADGRETRPYDAPPAQSMCTRIQAAPRLAHCLCKYQERSATGLFVQWLTCYRAIEFVYGAG